MGMSWRGSRGGKALFQIKWKASGQGILNSCCLLSDLLSSWFVPTLQSKPIAQIQPTYGFLPSILILVDAVPLVCLNVRTKGSCAVDSDQDGDSGSRLKHNPYSLSLSHPSLILQSMGSSSFADPLGSWGTPGGNISVRLFLSKIKKKTYYQRNQSMKSLKNKHTCSAMIMYKSLLYFKK